MKVGRRGFFATLFAAPITAKALLEKAPEPKPLPVQKYAAMPADHLMADLSALPSSTICCIVVQRPWVLHIDSPDCRCITCLDARGERWFV